MRYLAMGMILLAALTACSEEDPRPENLIPEETYIDLIVELQLLRSLHEQTGDRNRTDSLRREAFRKYEVDSTQFEESHLYYQQQMEEQKERIGEAIERLRRDRVIRPDTVEEEAAEPDTSAAGEPIPVDTAVADTAGT